MTMLQDQPADLPAPLAPDLAQPLTPDPAPPPASDPAGDVTQLQAAYAELREELAAVRRQRDEAITQAQWLITRVANAENTILQLQTAAAEPERSAVPRPAGEVAEPAPGGEEAAVEIPQQATEPALVADNAGPWLPPDEAPQGTTAQEFAALTEPAPEAEAAEVEEPAAPAPTPALALSSIDVLPERGTRKGSLHLRRR